MSDLCYEPLQPTPTGRDGKGRNQRDDNTCLAGALGEHWEKYLPAMERHARLVGRPWPPPAILGTKGQPVLNPAFVEWMMWLPQGWVTSLPIARTRQLHVLGNGVVAPCAHEAFTQLLGRISE